MQCVRRRVAPLGDAQSYEMCTVGVGRFFALVSVVDFTDFVHSIALPLRRCGWEWHRIWLGSIVVGAPLLGRANGIPQLQRLMPATGGPMVDGAPRLNRANGRHQLKHLVPAAEGAVVDGAPRLNRETSTPAPCACCRRASRRWRPPQLNRANGRHQLKHFAPAAEGPVVDGAPRRNRETSTPSPCACCRRASRR